MSLLAPHNDFDMPPGGWRYFCSETGEWSESFLSKFDMMASARTFFLRNGWLVPSESEILDQMCRRLVAEGIFSACAGDSIPNRRGRLALSWDTFRQGTMTLADWILSGGKASYSEACRRAELCSGCPLNDDPRGCKGCGMGAKIRNLISDVSSRVGGLQPTPHDDRLKACVACLCALKAKIYVPLDIIRRNMPEGQKELLWDRCWIK
jgi:hypothetical protein